MISRTAFNRGIYRVFKFGFKDFDPTKDYYKTLGIGKKADNKEIKTAYIKLAKLYHPDRTQGKTNDLFKEINEAYEVLSDSNVRSRYDSSFGRGGFNAYGNYQGRYDSGFGFNSYANYRSSGSNTKRDYSYNDDSVYGKAKTNFAKNYYSKNKKYFKNFQTKESNEDAQRNTHNDQFYYSNTTGSSNSDPNQSQFLHSLVFGLGIFIIVIILSTPRRSYNH